MTERISRPGRPRRRAVPERGAAHSPADAAGDAAGDANPPGAEPIVLAERITVIAEAPLAGDAVAPPGEEPLADPPAFAADGVPTSAAQRWRRIAERAYELARERDFEPGRELEDWLRAEAEVDAQLTGGP